MKLFARLLLLAGLALMPPVAGAQELPAPTDAPILEVSGKIGITNANNQNASVARFDRRTLESFGTVSFTTTTPWHKEPTTFEGVPLATLLKAVGASGQTIVVTALNDYSAEIPVEDAEEHGAILALKRNGEYMPIRDKGPIFVIYNFDGRANLKSQKYYSRSVWQVSRIEIK